METNVLSKFRSAVDRSCCWLYDGRKYNAPLNPYQLIQISPDKVRHCPITSPTSSLLRPSPVVGGNWDQQLRKFSDDVVYQSFCKRFKKGVEWKDTDYYEFMIDKITEDGSYKGINSQSDIDERCRKLDELYAVIERNGYKSQRLLNSGKISDLDTEPLLPPERKEITVNVARDGEFLWSGGAHRLSIAKILGIDLIPVRIRARHKQWQQIRDDVYTRETVIPACYEGHPDLKF